jgi:hypothetical protein
MAFFRFSDIANVDRTGYPEWDRTPELQALFDLHGTTPGHNTILIDRKVTPGVRRHPNGDPMRLYAQSYPIHIGANLWRGDVDLIFLPGCALELSTRPIPGKPGGGNDYYTTLAIGHLTSGIINIAQMNPIENVTVYNATIDASLLSDEDIQILAEASVSAAIGVYKGRSVTLTNCHVLEQGGYCGAYTAHTNTVGFKMLNCTSTMRKRLLRAVWLDGAQDAELNGCEVENAQNGISVSNNNDNGIAADDIRILNCKIENSTAAIVLNGRRCTVRGNTIGRIDNPANGTGDGTYWGVIAQCSSIADMDSSLIEYNVFNGCKQAVEIRGNINGHVVNNVTFERNSVLRHLLVEPVFEAQSGAGHVFRDNFVQTRYPTDAPLLHIAVNDDGTLKAQASEESNVVEYWHPHQIVL